MGLPNIALKIQSNAVHLDLFYYREIGTHDNLQQI